MASLVNLVFPLTCGTPGSSGPCPLPWPVQRPPEWPQPLQMCSGAGRWRPPGTTRSLGVVVSVTGEVRGVKVHRGCGVTHSLSWPSHAAVAAPAHPPQLPSACSCCFAEPGTSPPSPHTILRAIAVGRCVSLERWRGGGAFGDGMGALLCSPLAACSPSAVRACAPDHHAAGKKAVKGARYFISKLWFLTTRRSARPQVASTARARPRLSARPPRCIAPHRPEVLMFV